MKHEGSPGKNPREPVLFMSRRFLLPLLFLPLALHAQTQSEDDERHVVSPNGQLEFRMFVGHPEGALWTRIGYRIDYRGKPLLATSWIGLDFRDQEPLLAENAGLMYSDSGANAPDRYNYLVIHYGQNGSLGRRLDVEVRAWDNAIAFRYIIPRTTPLDDFLLRDEFTQFNFAQPGVLDQLPKQPDYDMPLAVEDPGVGWIAVATAGSHSGKVTYPAAYLIRFGKGLRTNLARSKTDPTVSYSGVTPLTWQWRVVLVGPDREHVFDSPILRSLSR